VPQLYANVDRVRAKQMGVNLGDIYDTMQVNLGSLYVNDFTKFGKTYQVIVQADAPFRADAQAIGALKTRNAAGEMVPLSALMTVEPTFGPTRVTRYNGYPSADLNGAPKPGFSSGQAEEEIEALLKKTLPRGMGYEWTELTYQDRLTRSVGLPGTSLTLPVIAAVMMIAVLLVILVLAAQYESWTLPMAIVLIVPMCVMAALLGVWISHFPPFAQPGDLNIFTQVALVVLVGLACKNAILIVEFAKELEERGEALLDAVIKACRMRLRPILMTSIAFCAGVLPLIFGSGAGSEMRRAMGIAVFSGMLGVTLFGIFLTPVFYVLLRGQDNNILTQVGFIVLIGLAAKNAILIVEFAKQLEDRGRDRITAAIEAARLRLRPILMTSLAFIFGVSPMVWAVGAGAELRQTLGTTVFSGMIGVTIFGLIFTPVFYVVSRWSAERLRRRRPEPAHHPAE